jgi:hypothetical protein
VKCPAESLDPSGVGILTGRNTDGPLEEARYSRLAHPRDASDIRECRYGIRALDETADTDNGINIVSVFLSIGMAPETRAKPGFLEHNP